MKQSDDFESVVTDFDFKKFEKLTTLTQQQN